MQLNTQMSFEQTKSLQKEMGAVNLANKYKRDPAKEGMGRDEFLKLLTVQMSHQDPLSPMENKEFIAQMAQFSSLEQMTHMNKSLESMKASYTQNNAYGMLGRTVDFISESGTPMKGEVTSLLIDEDSVKLNVKVGAMTTTAKVEDVLAVHK
ncbi:MAG: flagellar hook capping FlgD N-terminal domain-containing protein [Spirochaetota bacterium]